MKINKLYILGDSFSANGSDRRKNPSGKDAFWVDSLREYYDVYKYAESSRDTQTILDTWIKLLPQINENDFIIVGFPYFNRWRFPRSEKAYKKEHDLWIRHISSEGQYNVRNGDLEFYAKDTPMEPLLERLIDNQIIHSSVASSLNNKELIESLTKISKCGVLTWSWTRFRTGFKPEGLYDKTDLEKELGYWGTQDEMYTKSDGKFGYSGDLHWDEQTHHLFLNFVKNKIEK